MIATPKLRKLVMDSIAKHLQENSCNYDAIWIKVAKDLEDLGSFSEWRIKEFFSKEILPYLGINNYGYREDLIISMKFLGKMLYTKSTSQPQATSYSENFIIIDQANPLEVAQQNSVKNLLSAFEDPDDPLQILNNVPLRTFPNTIPNSSEMRNHISAIYENGHDYRYLSTGNQVQVRDEFGSSLIPQPQEYVTKFRMENFPMYDPVTDEIDYGAARSSFN